jgi:hypothetical protein
MTRRGLLGALLGGVIAVQAKLLPCAASVPRLVYPPESIQFLHNETMRLLRARLAEGEAIRKRFKDARSLDLTFRVGETMRVKLYRPSPGGNQPGV